MAAIRDKAKKFQKFLHGLRDKHPQALNEPERPLVERFVFYLLLYSNPATSARKAVKTFTNDQLFASWNEVRVSTVRELTEVLEEAKVSPAEFLAPRLKQFLQKVFEEADDTALEPLRERVEQTEKAQQKKVLLEKLRKFLGELPGIPPWGATYLMTGLGIDPQLPWDPATEAVLEEQKLFPPKSTLVQKKRIAKALMDGLEGMDLLDAHHLLVEHWKQNGGGTTPGGNGTGAPKTPAKRV